VVGGSRRPGPDGVDLTPGQPCLEAFPLAAWRTAWRHATAHVATRPPPAAGLPELRRAIAAYLLRTRGIVPAAHDIVVTAGLGHGLRLVLDALGWHGPAVAMEDPGPPDLRLAAAGPSPLPVDAEGARFDAIAPGARVAVVTPDAHVPLGHVLSGQRRQAALDWAAEVDGAIVEVGWDPVVRSTSGRIARLVTRTTRVPVAMVASLGGVLTPALGLGFAVVPRDLSAGVTHRLREAGGQPGHAAQLAVAHLLANGTAARRMRRLGQLYAGKRRLVEDLLGDGRRGLRLSGLHAPDTAVVHAPSAGADLHTAIGRRGIRAAALATYHLTRRADAGSLLIGYGHLPEPLLRAALEALAGAVRGPGPAPPSVDPVSRPDGRPGRTREC
jgi:GntR family transcriptional regulator/MocR family aminotransferase